MSLQSLNSLGWGATRRRTPATTAVSRAAQTPATSPVSAPVTRESPVSVLVDRLATGTTNTVAGAIIDAFSETTRPMGTQSPVKAAYGLDPDMSLAECQLSGNGLGEVGSWLSTIVRQAAPLVNAVVPGSAAITQALFPTRQPAPAAVAPTPAPVPQPCVVKTSKVPTWAWAAGGLVVGGAALYLLRGKKRR